MLPAVNPFSDQRTSQAVRQLARQMDNLRREQGEFRENSSILPAELPRPRDWIFAVIDEGNADGEFSFQQVQDHQPEKAIVMEAGIAGFMSKDGVEAKQPAKGLNGETDEDIQPGTVVFLVRSGLEWRFVGIINEPGYGSRAKRLKDVDIFCDAETGSATLIKQYE